jgi:uncharacterized membrane protein
MIGNVMNMFEHLHPMVVHFPIALLISAFIFEIGYHLLKRESLHQTAVYIYGLAVCVTPFVVWTGLLEAERHHLNHPVLTLHRNFALGLCWVSLISVPCLFWIHKRSPGIFKYIFLILLASCSACVVLAGFNGGRLVYEYGIGVEQ